MHEPGLYSDPASERAPPAGALHYVPTLTCGCGSRVLELLYCEACGEIFFGGYRRDTGLNPNEWYLSPDHPDLEASPDMASMDRDYLRYAVLLARSTRDSARVAAVDSGRCSSERGERRDSRRPTARLRSADPGTSTTCRQCTRRLRRPATARGRHIPLVALDVMPTGLAARSARLFAPFEPVSRRSRRCFRTLSCEISRRNREPVTQARGLLRQPARRRQALGGNALLALPGRAPPSNHGCHRRPRSGRAGVRVSGRRTACTRTATGAGRRVQWQPTRPKQLHSRWRPTRRRRSCRRHHTPASRARWRHNRFLARASAGTISHRRSSRLTHRRSCSPTV